MLILLFFINRDSSTPDEDWIISPHPASKNLYIAAGGSFHGYKFLPIIGKYIVQMLDGKLSEEHSRKWAWDRDSEFSHFVKFIASCER